jgi:hypothetical protein
MPQFFLPQLSHFLDFRSYVTVVMPYVIERAAPSARVVRMWFCKLEEAVAHTYMTVFLFLPHTYFRA